MTEPSHAERSVEAVEGLRESLTSAIRRLAERSVCKCGHPEKSHAYLTNRDVCKTPRCNCEWFAEAKR